MSPTLLSSPLQGFTDYRFRNTFNKYFGGVDTFYAPYIRLNGKMVIKANFDRDIQLKNNTTVNVIPQIMTNDADEFIFVTKFIQSLGYQELNWNLGCPYPMVINKCMGSGLINDPDRIDRILVLILIASPFRFIIMMHLLRSIFPVLLFAQHVINIKASSNINHPDSPYTCHCAE